MTGLHTALAALVHSDEAKRYREEACRGIVELPYASNRYVRLLDDVRALLTGHPASSREVGRCGDQAPAFVGAVAACRLPHGHFGWHRGDDGSEWSRDASVDPPPATDTDRGCAWSDFRKDYGVSANDETRRAEHRAFCAGWDAAQGALDAGGPLR